MSNLGAYQTMVTDAKSVGGPYALGAIVLAVGYVGGKAVEQLVKTMIKKFQLKKKNDFSEDLISVTVPGTDNSGLSFDVGDLYRILFSDHGTVLIEKIGDDNSPYVVSPDFLLSISNYN